MIESNITRTVMLIGGVIILGLLLTALATYYPEIKALINQMFMQRDLHISPSI